MKPSLRIFLSGLILGALGAVGWMLWPKDEEHLPDEKKVAMEVLIEKQSGPGYFHAAENTAPDEQGIVWMEPEHARGQIDRIIRERKWGEVEKAKILKLILEASEPHPSRSVGGERTNLAKLNLALDALP